VLLVDGLLTIDDHCTFRWREEPAGLRRFEIEPWHCAACVGQLRDHVEIKVARGTNPPELERLSPFFASKATAGK